MTLLLEWREAFDEPAPRWVERLAAANPANVELEQIAAGARVGGGGGREVDEILIDAVVGLGRSSQLVELIDSTVDDLLHNTDRTGSMSVLRTEALYRLLGVVAEDPSLFPASTSRCERFAETGEYVTLPSKTGRDIAALCLLVTAKAQTDDRFMPLWWRLCDLESLRPDHATIAFVGIRWAAATATEPEGILTNAVARLSEACVGVAREGMMSDAAGRRLFSRTVKFTVRARSDLDWGLIGRNAVASLSDANARALVERALAVSAAPSVTQTLSGVYEDPARAEKLAGQLSAAAPSSTLAATEFLEAQREHATRRGDVLPLVQSLSWFARSVRPHDPVQSEAWAREATRWQPANDYAVTAWAEALHEQQRSIEAVDVVLSRLHSNPSPALWSEAGKSLQLIGETVAAGEVLRAATERFASESAGWSGLGELYLRQGETERAEAVFREGLDRHPNNRFLLPGYARVLAHLGRRTEALALLDGAEDIPDMPQRLVETRRRQIATGVPLDVVKLPESDPSVLEKLSIEAAGELALMLRRSLHRDLLDRSERTEAKSKHERILRRLSAAGGIVAASEAALSNATVTVGPVMPIIGELVRVRAQRAAANGNTYDPDKFREMCIDAERAGAGDLRAVPLVGLSRLRAFSVVHDGQPLANEAHRAVSELTSVSPVGNGPAARFSRASRRYELTASVISNLDIPAEGAEPDRLRASVAHRPHVFDGLEEDLALALMR